MTTAIVSISRRVAPCRSGFTLAELLIAVGLFATVGLLASKLFYSSLRVTYRAETAQNRIATAEHMTTILRQDVWAARDIRMAAANSATIVRPDGAGITWNVNDDRTIERVLVRRGKPDEQTKWNELGNTLRFEQTPSGHLIIVERNPAGRQVARITMAPATSLMQEPKP